MLDFPRSGHMYMYILYDMYVCMSSVAKELKIWKHHGSFKKMVSDWINTAHTRCRGRIDKAIDYDKVRTCTYMYIHVHVHVAIIIPCIYIYIRKTMIRAFI